jgi:hypothetical protein
MGNNESGIILAIVGSRTFNNYDMFCKYVNKIKNIKLIISGGAKGADAFAKRYAEENNIPLKEYLADWDRYGKRAGYLRNVDIVTSSTHVLIYWDLISKGTKHDIDLAEQYNKPYIVININTGKIEKLRKKA